MAETTEMDEMPKIVESKQTEGLDGLAVETDDYFIINRNEHTYLYMVTVNILKAFLLPIFILTRLSKRYRGRCRSFRCWYLSFILRRSQEFPMRYSQTFWNNSKRRTDT
jgi:hypothetical protein